MSTALTTQSRTTSVRILSDLLPPLRAFALVAQNAHWVVQGPLFDPLHRLFGELYAHLVDMSDEIAERIAQLDEVPPQGIPYVEPMTSRDGAALIGVIDGLGQKVGSRVYVALDSLVSPDQVFHARLQDLQADLEKLLWKISSNGKA